MNVQRGPALDFAGRVAIVTGAGKGLGRAYARFLAAHGAAVIVNNRLAAAGPDSASRVVEEIRAAGGQAVAEHSDAADHECGERLVAAAMQHFGRLDILIANAGVTEIAPFRKQALENLRRVMEINFFGTLAVAHAAFRAMYDAGYGRILLTTSTAGLYGDPSIPAYSASKAAVLGLMRVLSLEGARKAILANAIAPYAVTQMTADLTPASLHASLDPDRVAPVAAWLVHERQQRSGQVFITGGGAIRVARIVESRSAFVPEEPETMDAVVDALSASTETRSMPSAQAEFASFIEELGLDS